MYSGRLRLRLTKGSFPYIEVVEEVLLLSQSHQRKGTEKAYFQKKQQKLHQQTKEIKQVKQMATLKHNYSSSQAAEFHPLLRVPRGHSTLQP